MQKGKYSAITYTDHGTYRRISAMSLFEGKSRVAFVKDLVDSYFKEKYPKGFGADLYQKYVDKEGHEKRT